MQMWNFLLQPRYLILLSSSKVLSTQGMLVCKMKHELYKQAADSLKQSLHVSLQCSMDLAQVKGASTWLTSLPILEFGFAFTQVRLSRCLGSSLQLATIVSSLCLWHKVSVEHALSSVMPQKWLPLHLTIMKKET